MSRLASVSATGLPQAPKTFDVRGLLKSLQANFNAFNTAGLEQYKGLMDLTKGLNASVMGPTGLYSQAFNQISQLGGTAARDIATREKQTLAQTEQDLVNRGLGNTTIRTNARRAVSNDATRARTTLAESLAGQRAGLLERQAGTALGLGQLTGDFMLSRQLVPPDLGTYAGLLQALAANGGAGGNAGGFRK